jgi:hypothetical protein
MSGKALVRNDQIYQGSPPDTKMIQTSPNDYEPLLSRCLALAQPPGTVQFGDDLQLLPTLLCALHHDKLLTLYEA